jgi:RNA polymerase sigma-70 factor, ECF subfamily
VWEWSYAFSHGNPSPRPITQGKTLTLEEVPVTPASDHLVAARETSPSRVAGATGPSGTCPTFDEVYEEHFSFVWRSVRALGVLPSHADDVVQDVFVVVHRRLADFDGARASIKTWLFGILRRTVADHRRTQRRKPAQFGTKEGDAEVEMLTDSQRMGPHESAARAEAVRVLSEVLEGLDDDKREVFILAEVEQMTVADIARATGLNVNTAYARLRAAREDFEQSVRRYRARDQFRAGGAR